MKKTILLLIIATGLATASAQMYNYMGNHIVLNMEGYFSPAWLNPNPMTPHIKSINKHAQRYLGINYFLSPSVELLVWDRGTVGVGYNYYNSPFYGTDDRVKVLNRPSHGYNYSYHEVPGNVTAHGFNLYYKHYFGGGFAPLGHNLKFTFDGYFYHYQMNTEGFTLQYQNVPEEERAAVLDNKGCLFGMKVEYGYDFIVFNRLKLTFGAGLGTTFGGYRVVDKRFREEIFSAFDFDDRPDKSIYYDSHARSRILGAYWFGVKLGVGVIPF